jgi:Lon protease-like protein
MKLNLTVWQREAIRLRVGNLQGTLAIMQKGLKVLNAVELTKEEKKKVGYRRAPRGFEWDDTETRFSVEINDREAINLVKRAVRELAADLETRELWTPQDAENLPDLCEQLKIDLDEVIAKVAEKKASAAEKESKSEKPAE